LSLPRGAKGFGRPSVPSGIRVMLESRKLANATPEKIESSSFIFLTERSRVRKSLVTKESGLMFEREVVEGGEAESGTRTVAEEESEPSSVAGFFIKKI